MIKHTDDPALRAESIANREAEMVWAFTHNWRMWMDAWVETYEAALRELQSSC